MSSNVSYPIASLLPPYSLGDGHISATQVPALAHTTTHLNGISRANVSSSAAAAGTKRKSQEDEDAQPSRKRRVKVFDVETSEIASGEARHVGARQWSDEEKAKLFTYLLGKDNIWENCSSRMNTIFRDAAVHVFDSKKTSTAIKSCYHRNVDTFKQMYALEKYLIQVTSVPVPPALPPRGFSPLPPSFPSDVERMTFIDRRIEAARALSVDLGVGNLTARTVEHWSCKGWYVLHKRRFKEDAATGQIVPYYGKDPSLSLLGQGLSLAAAALFPQHEIDVKIDAGVAQAEATTTQNDTKSSSACDSHENFNTSTVGSASLSLQSSQTTIKARPRKNTPAAIASNIAIFRVTPCPPETVPPYPKAPDQAVPQPQLQPQPQEQLQHEPRPQSPPLYNGAQVSYPGYSTHDHSYLNTAHMYSPPPSTCYGYSQPLPYTSAPQNLQIQFTQMVQSLANACTSLMDELRSQTERGKEMLDLLQRREEREAVLVSVLQNVDVIADWKERAALANEVLANPHASDDVKQAAKDFLKRLFV